LLGAVRGVWLQPV